MVMDGGKHREYKYKGESASGKELGVFRDRFGRTSPL